MKLDVLNQFGQILTSITGLGAAESTIILGIILALVPPLYRGVLDKRIESMIQSLDYTRGILVISTLLAYYYLFGKGLTSEIILISGGFIVGTAVQDWLKTLTDI